MADNQQQAQPQAAPAAQAARSRHFQTRRVPVPPSGQPAAAPPQRVVIDLNVNPAGGGGASPPSPSAAAVSPVAPAPSGRTPPATVASGSNDQTTAAWVLGGLLLLAVIILAATFGGGGEKVAYQPPSTVVTVPPPPPPAAASPSAPIGRGVLAEIGPPPAGWNWRNAKEGSDCPPGQQKYAAKKDWVRDHWHITFGCQ